MGPLPSQQLHPRTGVCLPCPSSSPGVHSERGWAGVALLWTLPSEVDRVLLQPPVGLGEVGERCLPSLPCWLGKGVGALQCPGSWWGFWPLWGGVAVQGGSMPVGRAAMTLASCMLDSACVPLTVEVFYVLAFFSFSSEAASSVSCC